MEAGMLPGFPRTGKNVVLAEPHGEVVLVEIEVLRQLPGQVWLLAVTGDPQHRAAPGGGSDAATGKGRKGHERHFATHAWDVRLDRLGTPVGSEKGEEIAVFDRLGQNLSRT